MAQQPIDHHLSEQNWNQVTKEVQKKWAHLNTSDLDRIDHDFNSLTDLVSLKTGLTHEETERRLDDIIALCGTQTTMDTSYPRKAGTQDSGTIEDDFDESAP
jgi:hypothetical protein